MKMEEFIEAEILGDSASMVTLKDYGNRYDDLFASTSNKPDHDEAPRMKKDPRARQKAAAMIKDFSNLEISMGKVVTTDDILNTEDTDENRQQASAETAAMLRNLGLNNYDSVSNFNQVKEIETADVIYEKKYPILLNQKYFKFPTKKNTGRETEEDEENLNSSNELLISKAGSSSQNSSATEKSNINKDSYSSSSSGAEPFPYIAFKNTLCDTTSRFRQPTIGIGNETFLKPCEIYIMKREKQGDVKRKRKAEAAKNGKK